MSSPDIATVGPNPFKVWGQLAIATVAITGGATMLVVVLEFLAAAGLLGWVPLPPWLWLHHRSVITCISVLLVGYCAIAPLVAVISGRPKIEIGPEGFVDYGVVGHRSRRWNDIEGSFTVIRVGWPMAFGLRPVVAYRLTDAFKQSARIKPVASLEGNDEAILICSELAIGAGELADLFNRWKHIAPNPTASPSAGAREQPASWLN
jgi:hypothetical protein